MTTNSDWELGSGLPLDGAQVEITDARFEFNAQIGANCLTLDYLIAESGDTRQQSYSIGNGWDIQNRGGEIVSDSGKPRKISGQSNYGRLIASAVAAAGEQVQSDVGNPKESAGWIGTKWTLQGVEVESTNPSTKETKVKTLITFGEYLGKSEGAASNGNGKAGGGAAKSGLAESDPELFASLVERAGAFEDHDAFMAAALEWDDVDGNKLATAAVMGTKAGTVWHAAHGA